MDIDPETDPLEVDEWVSTDDDSDDDGWSMFVDETGVLHHTGTLLKRAFFRDETAFRTLMEQPGKFRVLANGDLVVMGTNSPIPVGDDLERESTVCGVDFAVWDWGFGVDMGGSSR
ncbi:hypothetical protein V5O48_010504 [Marasmius crinis-equi]|uniref:Uncharacterized protein n=1 Tax=Marasmius crinis-equi TaxID=585013 RepID=A0ABR3F877_9AGAR